MCDDSYTCSYACNTDADCADGQACAKGGAVSTCNEGTSCVGYTDCTSTYNPGASGKRFARDFISVVAGGRGMHSERDGVGAISRMREKLREERKGRSDA